MGKQQLNYQPENVKSVVFDKDQEINRLKTETASFQWGGKKSTRRMQSICCKKGEEFILKQKIYHCEISSILAI